MGRRMELLVPAQGPEQLSMALHFGADAVYLAGPRWGMRAGARNFSADELAAAVETAHAAGAAVHVTLNTVMRDGDMDALPAFVAQLGELGVDAVIVADLGALELVRRVAPQVALHISTQASVMSAQTAEAYGRLGARRIVLAREMSLAQIAELRRRCTRELELEVFAHGSLCMAYSGRCLLSADVMGPARSASWGACAQPCRWAWSLVEERSGQVVPVEQDPSGTYLLSSRDLCLLEHLDALAEAGVDALKVEGRSKGSYYVACVTNAYRHVLDGAPASEWRGELDAVSHRPYSTGFLLGEPGQAGSRQAYARERTMVAVVRSCTQVGSLWRAGLVCRNRAEAGATLTLLAPGSPVRKLTLQGLEQRDEDGSWRPAPALVRNGALYRTVLDEPVGAGDVLCV